MASSNWSFDDLRFHNSHVADVLLFLFPKIQESRATTAMELGNELREYARLQYAKNNELLGTEALMNNFKSLTIAYAFVRYVIKEKGVAATEVISHHKKNDLYFDRGFHHIPPNEDPKPHVMRRAREFAMISTWAGEHIAKHAGALITAMTIKECVTGTLGHTLGLYTAETSNPNTYTILMHGPSTLFGLVVQETMQMMCREGDKEATLNFICTEEGPQDTSQLRHSKNLACGLDIPDSLQFPLPHATITQVNMVLIHADLVYASGAIISEMGTCQIATAAEAARIPIRVLVEGHLFSEDESPDGLFDRDYTPPQKMMKIVSNGGVFLCSNVPEILEKQYARLISA